MTQTTAAASSRWLKVLGFVAVAAALYYFLARPAKPPLEKRVAPEIVLPGVAGREVTLSSFRGQVVLLDFWATWCEPCLEELPDLIRFHEAYKDKGFTVVGVAMDSEGASILGPFVRQNKIPYPVLLSRGDAPPGYAIPGMPTAFLLDREGVIVRRYLGPKSYEELERDVSELLSAR